MKIISQDTVECPIDFDLMKSHSVFEGDLGFKYKGTHMAKDKTVFGFNFYTPDGFMEMFQSVIAPKKVNFKRK